MVIVNQSFARRYFEGAEPLGKRFGIDGPAEEGTEPPTLCPSVVGVVPDLYMDGTDNEDPEGMTCRSRNTTAPSPACSPARAASR